MLRLCSTLSINMICNVFLSSFENETKCTGKLASFPCLGYLTGEFYSFKIIRFLTEKEYLTAYLYVCLSFMSVKTNLHLHCMVCQIAVETFQIFVFYHAIQFSELRLSLFSSKMFPSPQMHFSTFSTS